MIITFDLANTIVENIEEIIKQNINFMNVNGEIIASSNKNRLGAFHEAAYKCAQTGKTIVIENNNEYEGAKKGINIPVYLNNKVAGVIGISGEIKEISVYGNIVKKMTEILLTESWIKDNMLEQKEAEKNLIEKLLFGNNDFENYISNSSKNYNKFIVVASSDKYDYNPKFSNKIYSIIEELDIQNVNRISAVFANEIILIYSNISKKLILNELKLLNKKIMKELKIDLKYGISQKFINHDCYKIQYKYAKYALHWILKYEPEINHLSYDNMDLGILLSNINDDSINQFTNKVLGNLDFNEINENKELLESYTYNNGSITKTSEDLYLHKNTIQYRLNRLYDLTGYNPRELKDYVILKLAFLLIKE